MKWEVKKLGEVVEFQRGLTYSKKDEVDFSDNIVLRSNNVDLETHKLIFDDLKYINSSIIVPENKKVQKGALIICTANGSKSHLGKVALIEEDYNFSFGGFMGLIKPHEEINAKFLFYLMISDNYKEFIHTLADGANINNLKFSDLSNFLIPLPPLSEQKKIVEVLDQAFAGIEQSRQKTKQNLKNAKEIFESYLQFALTPPQGDALSLPKSDTLSLPKSDALSLPKWEIKKLGEVCEILDRLRKPITKKDRITGDYPYYGATGILSYVDSYIFSEKLVLIGEDGAKWQSGDNTAFIVDGKYWVNNHAHVIRPDRKIILDDWIVYYLNFSDLTSFITGVTVPKLNQEKMRDINIPLPPLSEQKKIVQELDALKTQTEALEQIYTQKLNDLDELKKSLLQKAFAGELVK